MAKEPPRRPRKQEDEAALVDRLLRQLPYADPTLSDKPNPGSVRPMPNNASSSLAPRPGPPPGPTNNQRWGTWAKIALGIVMAVAITQWPYGHACGFGLFFYVFAIGTVLLAGLWAALFAWKYRQGAAHLFSQALVLWGLVLCAGVLLPRVGYAKDEATWRCWDTAAEEPVGPAVPQAGPEGVGAAGAVAGPDSATGVLQLPDSTLQDSAAVVPDSGPAVPDTGSIGSS